MKKLIYITVLLFITQPIISQPTIGNGREKNNCIDSLIPKVMATMLFVMT